MSEMCQTISLLCISQEFALSGHKNNSHWEFAHATQVRPHRREVIHLTSAAAMAGLTGSLRNAAAQPTWNAGQLAHVIPTANHERFLIKTSFKSAFEMPPVLRVDTRPVRGIKTDTAGRARSRVL